MGERPAGSTGLQRLDERVLRKGDIVLVTARAAVSAAIRMATRSDVSHAMVCVEDRSVIDATDEGVHSRNTQRHFLDARCPVYVLRLKGGLASAQLEAVTDFLRGAIATRYSVPQAMLAGVGGLGVPASKQQFCSRLVAQAFASAGIDLVADPDFCSPADLRSSALLEVVPNATVAVNEAEVEFWSSREDIPQLMRDVTNALLAGARSIDPGIESPDDIATFLRGHPERDDDMSRILEASGYLTLWERERAKNPWQYEPGLMALESEVAMRSYCASVLANEGPGPNRYVRNRATYAWLAAHFGLRYFALMQELHETLADLHRQRIETAKAWSRKRGIAVDGPRPHLEPHTAAWFAALEEWDPPQALMARTITQAAGRVDVCSVCGDDPANDYRLAEEFRPPAGVDTWRLCDDCAASRLDAGEPITPVA